MDGNRIGNALTSIMEQRGWTQARLAAELDLDQPRISRVISGKLDLKINKVARSLARVGWEVVIRPRQKGTGNVKRREFGAKAVAAAASITVLSSAKASPYEDPDYLSALAGRMGRLKYEQGGLPLLSEVARHLEGIKDLQSSNNLRLLSAGSRLADKLSLVLFDAAKTAPAEKVGLLALSLGKKSKDAYCVGAAYESLVIQTTRIDHERAGNYAYKGVKVPDLPEDLKARLHARYAASLRGAQENSLSMSQLNYARGIALDDREGQPVVDGITGLVLYRLGRPEEGKESLGKAIRAFTGYPQLHARWLSQQVRASLLARDFGSAVTQMQELTLLLPLVSSAQLLEDLRCIFRLAPQSAHVPEVAQAMDALRSVTPKPRPPG